MQVGRACGLSDRHRALLPKQKVDTEASMTISAHSTGSSAAVSDRASGSRFGGPPHPRDSSMALGVSTGADGDRVYPWDDPAEPTLHELLCAFDDVEEPLSLDDIREFRTEYRRHYCEVSVSGRGSGHGGSERPLR